MANSLTVRNLAPEIVRALRERAASNGHSVQAEHRKILEEALRRPKRRSFAEVLSSMPNVGLDSDFERRGE